MPNRTRPTKTKQGLKLGVHVSAAGSIADAPLRAHELGCESFQFFARSPRGGPAPALTDEIVELFQRRCREFDLPSVIHAPYYINFASAKPETRHAAITVLRDELERGSRLGCQAMMTHLGSAKNVGSKAALRLTIEGIAAMLKGYSGETRFLIELSAGAGEIIGDTFEEVRDIIKGVERTVKHRVGVCFDTCHAFASGYDLRTPASVKKTLAAFDQIIGLDRLIVVHLNDAKFGLGSHKDRHEHIGLGEIGNNGFRELMRLKPFDGLIGILETPQDDQLAHDLATLKHFRGA
jgi:deoxyribonuclease-4